MRTLILFLLIFIGSTNIYAQSFCNGQEIYLQDSKNKKPKDWTGNGAPIRRSISFQPIHVYLYNNIISFDLKGALSSVAISVINEITGESIYLENYNSPNSIIIDLSAENGGCYLIRIEYDDILLEGHFVLE